MPPVFQQLRCLFSLGECKHDSSLRKCFRGISSQNSGIPRSLANSRRRALSHCVSKKTWEGIKKMQRDTENVGEYQVPVDPMDDLNCEACE